MFKSGGEVCGIASEENDDFMAYTNIGDILIKHLELSLGVEILNKLK